MSDTAVNTKRFILIPPAVQAIAALAAHDDEEPDGIPDYGNRNLAGGAPTSVVTRFATKRLERNGD